jgi:hypothetical protein
MSTRIEQCISVIKQIRDLGIPNEYPPLKELSKRMSDYIKTGDPWSGKIKFEAYGRVADVILPRRADRDISVTLRRLS